MDINRKAPAHATAETTINASRARVWAVLADIASWPRWNPDVKEVEVKGPVEPGTEFRWKAGGMSIVSRLEEVQPEQRIVWTGRTLGIRAIHVWTLEVRGRGTRIRTEESFEGRLVRVLAIPIRRMLAKTLRKTLAALKVEVEGKVG